MLVLAILSFQTGPEGGPQFPIVERSTYWYRDLFGLNPPSRITPLPIEAGLLRSLALAFMTTLVSTVLGVMSAQAFRQKFRGSGAVFSLIVLGMMMPGVLVGLGTALLHHPDRALADLGGKRGARFVMAPLSQDQERPGNPARFTRRAPATRRGRIISRIGTLRPRTNRETR